MKRLIHPSTLDFLREARRTRRRTRQFSFWDWLHGYIYGRWVYLYISIGTGEHPLARIFGPFVNGFLSFRRQFRRAFKVLVGRENRAAGGSSAGKRERITLADTYHGKVLPLAAARQLVTVKEDIHIENLEKIIPYALARDIILKNPDHIVAMECPCRSARENPCLPLDVCLIVGEPFASFVAEHHPRRSRWITSPEAVEILQAEAARGHVHHAFFKDAMFGRFYAICNCCACCCGAMQAQRNGTPMLASSGYVARVEEDLCIGCDACSEACQFGALSLDGFVMQVDKNLCMGCGVCLSRCAQGALELQRSPDKGEPLEIFALLEKYR